MFEVPDTSNNSPDIEDIDFESQKEYFQSELERILNIQVTVENIYNFIDVSMDDLLKLNDEVLNVYRNEKEDVDSITTKDAEDLAYEYFGLQSIPDILDSVSKIKDRIDDIKDQLIQHTQKTGVEIVPPDEKEIEKGDGSFVESHDLYPRLLTLMYILKTDFDLDLGSGVDITEGEIGENRYREEPYNRVVIKSLGRAVYICDEEGNASYIFDLEKLKQQKISLETLDLMGKEERNDLISKNPGIGIRIIQSPNWRDKMSSLLESEIVEEIEDGDLGSIPELKREKKEWLSFDEFKKEVRASYNGETNIAIWYEQERKKHKNWPSRSRLEAVYSKDGFTNFYDLLEIENVREREWLAFEDFVHQVVNLYDPKHGGVSSWYKKERKKHSDWPSNPEYVYSTEWTGWPELVGVENRLKKDWLSFEDFKKEVSSFYDVNYGNVQKWYRQERKKHKNWPATPHRVYPEMKGWPELVGRDVEEKKEWLPFREFKEEVIRFFDGSSNIHKWYRKKRKEYPHWPSSPEHVYRKEWTGWSELVGIENRLKKEWLPFDEFKKEVRSLYNDETNIAAWYKQERKNHKNWPAYPNDKYKEVWRGWLDLVGKE